MRPPARAQVGITVASSEVLEAIYGYWSAVTFCPFFLALAIISAARLTRPHESRPLDLKCDTCTGNPARRPISIASSTAASNLTFSLRIWLA